MALAPAQMIPSSIVVPEVSATPIPGVAGSGFTVMVVVFDAEHPLAFVTVTV